MSSGEDFSDEVKVYCDENGPEDEKVMFDAEEITAENDAFNTFCGLLHIANNQGRSVNDLLADLRQN